MNFLLFVLVGRRTRHAQVDVGARFPQNNILRGASLRLFFVADFWYTDFNSTSGGILFFFKNMDKKILEEFRVKLETKKKVIISQLETIGHRSQGAETNFDADFPDYGDSAEDNAVEVADYTKNLSLERDLEKDLGGVEKALKRIKDGSYGKCTYCGKDIEIERLMIRPKSNSCVGCKQILKRK